MASRPEPPSPAPATPPGASGSRRRGRIRRLAMRAALYALVAGAALELVLRIVTDLPTFPLTEVDGVELLPEDRDIVLGGVLGEDTILYATDSAGARASSRGRGAQGKDEVLVFGDSQALGWGLEFDQTFGSLVAAERFDDPARARLLAGPALDPGVYGVLLARYRRAYGRTPSLRIVCVNIGNDFHEMFLARRTAYRSRRGLVYRWAREHSHVYLHLYALWNRSLRAVHEGASPGFSSIMDTAKPGERSRLADHLVETLCDFDRALAADGGATCFLTIPHDIQIFPASFRKYRQYYHCESDWKKRDDRRDELARELDRLDRRIAQGLSERGRRVVRAAEAFQGIADWDELFAGSSHHLRKRAHREIADAVLRALTAEAEAR